MNRDDNLQKLCRKYLARLRNTAKELGLLWWVDSKIDENLKDRCSGTEEQVEMLSRMCDDERVSRKDIPKMLGKSYSFSALSMSPWERSRHWDFKAALLVGCIILIISLSILFFLNHDIKRVM